MSDIEKILDASQAPAWNRHRHTWPISYRSKYTREAFEAGFKAGLEFARIAAGQEGSSDG